MASAVSAAGQVYKQTVDPVHLGGVVSSNEWGPSQCRSEAHVDSRGNRRASTDLGGESMAAGVCACP